MTDWQVRPLGDVIELQRGYDLTEADRTPGCVPVIGSAGQNGWHDRAKAEGPGVTVGRSGASIGAVTFTKEDYWPHNTVLYVKDFKGNEPAFVAMLLQGLNLAALNSGSAQPSLNRNFVYPIEVRLPSPPLQRRIASFLSAYDGLIEVNQRRIAILEDMARRLFDEWFVRFRYPGHEAVPLVETELGMAPEGWTPGTIADLSSFISRGLAPRYDDEASSLVINQKCIRDQSLNLSPARKQSKPIPPSKLVIDGDILINSTGVGTLGRVAQLLGALPNATVDTHVTIVRAVEQVDLHYFGLQLLQLQPHFERQGIGATGQTELSRTAIADTKIIIPTSDLASRFGQIAGPLRCQAELLRNQNNKLRAARDLLLPKLISGEIDVSVAEETFAEAAE